MTIVGAGGVVIRSISPSRRFKKEFRKLDKAIRTRAEAKLQDLLKDPRPPGLAFEKLEGHSNPAVYTVHVTGNYKISFEVEGTDAFLRRVATHNEIDRAP